MLSRYRDVCAIGTPILNNQRKALISLPSAKSGVQNYLTITGLTGIDRYARLLLMVGARRLLLVSDVIGFKVT